MADETTLTAFESKLPMVASRAQLKLEWDDARGAHALALRDTLLVGTAESAGCVLADRLVSRLHCELEQRDDGWWVRDLKSRNGTYVDGLKVSAARIPEAGATLTVGTTKLRLSFTAPQQQPLWPLESFGGMVARSDVMRALFNRVTELGRSAACVLIQGETGTGKELIARAIHSTSPRAQAPFIVVDCGALPEALLESELFGHARGAFTGADHARTGAIEAAQGCTVFLDEVGELPLPVQPRLLRALESKTVRRVGENTHHAVDVRFIAATHRDLQSMVADGTFREDLYFRLAVLPLRVPPLRSRPQDVPVLLQHLLGRQPPAAALERALSYAWPGNVRELKSFAERLDALGEAAALELLGQGQLEAPLPSPGGAPGGLEPVSADIPFKVLRERWNDYLEREYLKLLIAAHGRNTLTLAQAAGLDRSYVHRLLRKHNL